jgi:2-dehydropantoate 2-reductase
MRVVVIGAGALGSVLGGLLFDAGVNVVLVRRDTQVVDHIREQGLVLETPWGTKTLSMPVVTDPAKAGKADVVFVLVKAYDTRSAIPAVDAVMDSDTAIITLQNGVGNYEILNEAFPDRALLGTTTNGALTVRPGVVRHTGIGQTHLGEYDGLMTDRARAIGALLQKPDLGAVHVTPNAVGAVWSKLIVNAAINAPGTLLRLKNGDIPITEAGRELLSAIVQEAVRVVRTKGIKLMFDNAEQQVLNVCEATASNLNSMLQDINAGRKTEIDFINGAIAREASEIGIDAPVSRTLTQLIQVLEVTARSRVPEVSEAGS